MCPCFKPCSDDFTLRRETSEIVDLDWGNLGFGIIQTDYECVAKCGSDEIFSKGEVKPFGPITRSPCAARVLNYGQGLFEGLKAFTRTDGSILLSRPEVAITRMRNGVERMCVAAPYQFVDAVHVLANKRWKGLCSVNLIVQDQFHHASLGGTGGVKPIGNYASVLEVQNITKEKGYSGVLYLDVVHNKYLQEVSLCNYFSVKGNIMSVPATKGTILPCITRNSIIEVAQSKGFKVTEHLISVHELLDADEVLCTGTAVVVSPLGNITYLEKRL
ncbi:hypothetical protein PR202_gb21723 [Eleusine coracana subsp. coracana]|uniref:Branched-chain-amino-acid transaminase n=1 Tax=Eleusine coracana subsp. coracana TaxID=191504 RepID=A0AAV5FED8_ELECO|nr:hypothetical protein PR202_gb21723 [Eleusine coracana subsp. coracana]